METSSTPDAPRGAAAAVQLRRIVHHLRTEGGTPARDAVAIGVGVLIGCSPFYGLHLALCWAAGSLLRLNRLKMYLAANISNPLVAPFLVLAELQAGAWVRRGELHALTVDAVRTTDPWTFGGDLLAGSAIVGIVLGTVAGLLTWLSTRGGDPDFAGLVRRASDRYVATSITAWEFARGKLRGDPIYRRVLAGGLLPPGGRLVDVGCGQGLMLALLAEAAADWRRGVWPPGWPAPPCFDEMIGLELRPRVAAIARRALGTSARIVEGDAAAAELPESTAVLLFDVLHLMSEDGQQALLRSVARSLVPGGVVLVREADADAGWRFSMVKLGNRLKALAVGRWRQAFCFRGAAGWRRWFEAAGFHVSALPAGEGTPFGNVLFVLRRPAPASA